ncbi:7484_t:CDS:1 [Ambispora leptoticha]|uniref:7483_t:CDS:1 n=1 Tax=Ambispora leptoticha TaxID=144679 RepID=A0A9N8ZFX1_9GLOM|nr:7483_t:CDS:1 [Ambispora leptoticha]CAG8487351.1 7484_t:CDS:1 [Ambispora leptoticha]
MPSPNTTVIPAASPNSTNKMTEYEVIVFPDSATNTTVTTSNDDNPLPSQQTPRAKTKHITYNGQSGQMFWIPEGYRPLLVRTADLPLLVGAEFPLSPGLSSDEESN